MTAPGQRHAPRRAAPFEQANAQGGTVKSYSVQSITHVAGTCSLRASAEALAAQLADEAESKRLQHGLVLVDAIELVHRIVDVQDRGPFADAKEVAHLPRRFPFHGP